MNRKLKVGDVIWTETFSVLRSDGAREWFWFRRANNAMTQQEALQEAIDKQQLRGPFASEADADEDMRIVLLGPQCEVTEAGMWDRAWEKPQ